FLSPLDSSTDRDRSSFLANFGLRAYPSTLYLPPNYAAAFLIGNFVSAYLILAPRTAKQYYGFDHQSSPREDVAKYGPKMVSDGKISQSTLDMIKRWGFAHNNAIESYPFFTSAVLLALHAHIKTGTLNGLMALYTVARLAYAVAYVSIESDTISQLRGLLWWVGNFSCLTMMYLAGKKMQVQ
ncbi:hypothetical protein D0Z07_5747, partial [Hyphodiscus hymeniophilus]